MLDLVLGLFQYALFLIASQNGNQGFISEAISG